MVNSPQMGNEMGGLYDAAQGTKDSFNGVLGNPKGLDLVGIAKQMAQTNHVNKQTKKKSTKK